MYDTNFVYQGTVTDQSFGGDFKGNPQLTLTVKITHRLRDRFRPRAGVDPVETPEEVDVRVNLPTDDAKRLRLNLNDLAAYGFSCTTPEDIDRLDPAHPEAFLFSGTTVNLAPSDKTNKEGAPYWNLRVTTRSFNKDKLREAVASALEPSPI